MIKLKRYSRTALGAVVTGSSDSFKLSLNIVKALPVRSWKADKKVWAVPLRDLPLIAKRCKAKGIKCFLEDDTIKQSYLSLYKDGLNRIEIKKDYKREWPEMDVLKHPLRKFQMSGSLFAYMAPRGALIGDMVGLGKTVQSLAVAERKFREGTINFTIIIATSTLVENWAPEVIKFTDRDFQKLSAGTPKTKRHKIYKGLAKKEGFILNYDIIKNDWEYINKYILERGFRFELILDEVQKIKNSKTKRAKYIKRLSARAVHTIGLSATSMENTPLDLWSIYQCWDWTVMGDERSYVHFCERYLDIDYFGKVKGGKNKKELRARMNTTFVRRLKDWVLDELPDRVEHTYKIELSPLQKQLYKDVRNRIVDGIKCPDKAQRISQAEVLSLNVYLHQLCQSSALIQHEKEESTKLEELMEFMESLDENSKVVVFSHYVPMVEIIAEKFTEAGITNIFMHGKNTKAKDRVPIANAWNDDPSSKALITSDILREGVNVPAANYIIHFDILYNPALMEQRVGRLDRLDSVHDSINIIYMVAKDTMEEKSVWAIQSAKKDEASEILDGGEKEARLTEKEILSLLDASNNET